MTRKIYKAVCTAVLAVFCVTMLLIMGVLYGYFSDVQQKLLRNETSLAARGVELSSADYFEGLDTESYRITWISDDGAVLFDSASNSDAMENHLEREEVKQAIAEGIGESARYSKTLLERYLYRAQKLNDGSVIRLSVAHESILQLLLGMLQPILMIIVVGAVLAFVLANRLSKRIIGPLNKLNLEEPLENEGYPELDPLLNRIHSQQQEIRWQTNSLATKQNELDTITENMSEGMLLLDSSSKLIVINRAAKELLDVSAGMVEKPIFDVSGNQVLLDAVQTASAGTSCMVKTELHGKVIQINAAPIQSKQGISGTAVVLFDITQQECAEQQRREFTANVSHELKTPLQSISGYSELLKCGLVEPDKIRPFSEKIYNESQRLISLVQDIINLSRLDEGGVELEWADVDLYETSEQVIKEFSDAAESSEVTLTLEGNAVSVYAVPKLIHDMIGNLVENAIKYNKKGGTVLVSVGEKYVSVKDSGIGIPPEHIDRVFERFYRVDKSHSKEVGGTGLGLSIVKHAAMILGAKIDIQSKVGEGTEIRIEF